MADVNATDLTQETYSTLDGTEQFIMFDSAEGKRATVAAVGEYVLKKLTTSLNGSTQTVDNALASLNSELVKAPDYYKTNWGTTLTFSMPTNQMGLCLINGQILWGLWHNSGGLSKTLLVGADTNTQFDLSSDGVVTITRSSNCAMLAIISA